MKSNFRSRDPLIARWQQRGIELLRQALYQLQRLLAVHRPPQALALIPVRITQPRASHSRHQRRWRD